MGIGNLDNGSLNYNPHGRAKKKKFKHTVDIKDSEIPDHYREKIQKASNKTDVVFYLLGLSYHEEVELDIDELRLFVQMKLKELVDDYEYTLSELADSVHITRSMLRDVLKDDKQVGKRTVLTLTYHFNNYIRSKLKLPEVDYEKIIE